MESKIPVFFSIVLIFLPLLLFADNTSIYLVISFIILFIISLDSILFVLETKNDKELDEEIDKLKSEFESIASLNMKRLELGFKTAKSIFIVTFVVSVLFILNINVVVTALSVLVLFFSIVELKNFKSSKIMHITFVSGIINMIYLAIVALTRYLF